MNVLINSISIDSDKVVFKGIQVDRFLFCDNLDEQLEEDEKTFIFDRNLYNGAAMKYLFKIVMSQRACQNGKTMAEKLNLLIGQILSLNGSFLQQDTEIQPAKKNTRGKSKK